MAGRRTSPRRATPPPAGRRRTAPGSSGGCASWARACGASWGHDGSAAAPCTAADHHGHNGHCEGRRLPRPFVDTDIAGMVKAARVAPPLCAVLAWWGVASAASAAWWILVLCRDQWVWRRRGFKA